MPPRAPRTFAAHTRSWLQSPGTEIRMEDRQDPTQSVIEEVASILATGYLRLRNARTLPDRGGNQEPAQGLDSAPDTSPHRAGS
jgi:hypothetical protein